MSPFLKFLKIAFWDIFFNRGFIVVSLIGVGIGIGGYVILQLGQQPRQTKIYKVPPRAQQRIEKQTSIKHITDHQVHDASPAQKFQEAEVIEIDPAERERIERMEARLQEIAAEMEVLGPKANKDIKLFPRLLELEEESRRLYQDIGRLHVEEGTDPFIGLEMMKFAATHMTEQGMPVSIGPRLADYFEKMGDFEAAEKMREATRQAEESGDEFFRPEHVQVPMAETAPSDQVPTNLWEEPTRADTYNHRRATSVVEREKVTTEVPSAPEGPPTEETFEASLKERFSSERFEQAMSTLDRHGPEEGLRRLRESDPELARQIEAARNGEEQQRDRKDSEEYE